MADLHTRINFRGYAEYQDPNTGEWIQTHRRAAEKKYGELPPSTHVHHRNGDKLDNRWSNLTVVTPSVHGRLHSNPSACDRCGRRGHWKADCYATTDFNGNRIRRGR